MKARRLTPELLDTLPSSAPAAQASRRDLQRLHPLLGQIGLWTRWFLDYFPHRPPLSLADLGAGDGSLLAAVLLRAYPLGGHGGRIFLVDRQPVIPDSTLAHLRRHNWLPTVVAAEAAEWLEESRPLEVTMANLFLHHLDEPEIKRLFSVLPQKTTSFAVAEPRRTLLAQWGALSLGLLGCHPVTRHDARVSVEAGFRDRELTELWPSSLGWHLSEKPAGPFIHFFSARKIS